MQDILRFTAATLLTFLTACNLATGQWMGKQTGCYAHSVTANPIAAHPNRPTVANPADITQYGVLELEYGWDRLWPEWGIDQTSAGGLLKLGMLCDVEMRWNTTSFLSQTDPSGTHRSSGDNWLGSQIRIYRQTTRVPTLAFSYAIKIPSARSDDGLGTGRVDHVFTLLASKDIKRFHFDFNISEFLIGRPDTSGFDRNQQVNLAFSHVIHDGLEITGEVYGDTRLNQMTPGFVSSPWALTYTVLPRLVIDGGLEVGLTSGGPHRHAFVGATYSIANLYLAWRRKCRSSPANRARERSLPSLARPSCNATCWSLERIHSRTDCSASFSRSLLRKA